MPKLKEVELGKNKMSWTKINLIQYNRMISTAIPKRELNNFISKGMEIEKITLTFKHNNKVKGL